MIIKLLESLLRERDKSLDKVNNQVRGMSELREKKSEKQSSAPLAHLQNSSFDGSFVAGIAQLRYLYSMPVERIVAYFNENGFNIDKQTAHGLLKKTALLFDNLYKAASYMLNEWD